MNQHQSFRVREAVHGDAAEWMRLRKQLWPRASNEADVAAFFAGKSREPAAVFVAEESDVARLCGFAEISVRRDYVEGAHSSPVAYLEGWFVEAVFRGRGVGRALIEEAERWARSGGFAEFGSDTALDNLAGAKAHRACGFKEVSQAVHFVKKLISD